VLADSYILIMHMGRQYPFDIIGKSFSTIPFSSPNGDLITNFDLLFSLMTKQISGIDDDYSGLPISDSGMNEINSKLESFVEFIFFQLYYQVFTFVALTLCLY
jgi:hypothetical protein